MKTNKKYEGSWSTGSTYINPMSSNNKHALARQLKRELRGTVCAGSSGTWSVWEVTGNMDYDTTVLSGTIRN